jgi:hypothetical protein
MMPLRRERRRQSWLPASDLILDAYERRGQEIAFVEGDASVQDVSPQVHQ